MSIVLIVFLMAGKTGGGSALEDVVNVAPGAVYCGVGAGQREVGFCMVEGGLFPIAGIMAGGAVLT